MFPVCGRKFTGRQAEFDEIVVRVFCIDRPAPFMVQLQDIISGIQPLLHAYVERIHIRHVKGDVIYLIWHTSCFGKVGFKPFRPGDLMHFPERNEFAVIYQTVEEVFCPPTFRDGRHFNLHQIQTHHSLIDGMNGCHVFRGECQMVISHMLFPPSICLCRPCSSHRKTHRLHHHYRGAWALRQRVHLHRHIRA